MRHSPNLWALLGAISRPIGQGSLPPEIGMQLISEIVGKIEEVYPQAKGEVIPGGLSDYLTKSITVQGKIQKWSWFLKPVELACLQVEACQFSIF